MCSTVSKCCNMGKGTTLREQAMRNSCHPPLILSYSVAESSIEGTIIDQATQQTKHDFGIYRRLSQSHQRLKPHSPSHSGAPCSSPSLP